MKILNVIQSYYPATVYGGPIFSVHFAAQALARSGHELSASTTNANRPDRLDVPINQPVKFEPRYHVRYYHDTILDRFSWGFTRNIARDIASCDVVHLQDVFSTYALITVFHAMRQKKPLVISPRGVFSSWALSAKRSAAKQFWIKWLFAPLVRRHPALLWHATSEQEAKDTTAIFPESQPIVVVNGVDLAAYDLVEIPDRTEWTQRFLGRQINADVQILLTMGRIHQVKGLDIALEALALLRKQGRKFVFVIAGRDEGASIDLIAQAKKLGIDDCVSFAGEVLGDDKIRFLKGADLFLFSSRSENFGLACLEALAAGVPVIASKDTPWASLENHGAGRWVDNNAVAIAKAINSLSTANMPAMRRAAQALAGEFGFENVARQFSSSYEKLLTQSIRVSKI